MKSIALSRFKGAKSVNISFGAGAERSVITLIGLNESGKTTILEGVSHFATSDQDVVKLFDSYTKREILSFIPIDKKAAFTGRVDISVEAILDSKDHEKIAEAFAAGGYEADRSRMPTNITIRKSFEFKDSDFVKPTYGTNWTGFDIFVRKSRKGKFKKYERPSQAASTDYWNVATDIVSNRLPNIAYFPTFLVDMPARIYLAQHEGETATNRYYRKILQNILDSLGEGITIEAHVVERISKYRRENPIVAWYSAFFGDPSKRNVDSVFLKASTKVTKEVLGTWSKIFNRPATAKRIEITWNVDPDKENIPYASFSVSDGESPYALSERSLGFRWFFSFLLFTRFGGARGRPNLFLFDEPAANLHARAQAQLLNSFDKIVEEGNSIIYSTHSNHMINPRWLSGAYIVENEAIDYESSDSATDFSVLPTLITATPYNRFVGENGSRVSYFQPVLERLQYIEPAIAATGRQLMVEGPSDFYAFSYVAKRMVPSLNLSIVPGGGSGSLDAMIEISLSRGNRFVILLDDDKEGRKAQQRYRDVWSLGRETVITIAECDQAWAGKRLEALICAETMSRVRKEFEGVANKKQVLLYLASSHFRADGVIGDETFENIRVILEKVSKRMDEN